MNQVKSDMGAYAGAARRRVHLAGVLLHPPSGHRPGRRQARHAHILQIRVWTSRRQNKIEKVAIRLYKIT